jgi:hypothetical protein
LPDDGFSLWNMGAADGASVHELRWGWAVVSTAMGFEELSAALETNPPHDDEKNQEEQ